MSRRLGLALGLFLAGITADATTTYVAITSGPYVEGSPVGRHFIDRFGLLYGMVATKVVGMVVVAIPVALARQSREFVLAVMFGAVGLLSFGAAAYNLYAMAGA